MKEKVFAMALDEKLLRRTIVSQMSAWLADMPEDLRSAPMFASADDDGEALSPEDILEQVRRGTELGDRLLMQAVANVFVERFAGGSSEESETMGSHASYAPDEDE
jgi:hypothetical protein